MSLKRTIGVKSPSRNAKGLYQHVGIRGPIEPKKPPTLAVTSVQPTQKIRSAAHAVRFLLAWLGSEQHFELEPGLVLELKRRLYVLHIGGALGSLISQEISKFPTEDQTRILEGFLAGRWADMLDPSL